MDVFPAFVPLTGRRVGLTGSGEGLAARHRLLSGSPAQIVDLDLSEAADPRSWAGMALGFVADPDPAACAAAAAAARAAGVPVNVMDRPALCDFTVPAIIDRGAVVAALGTGGASPLLVSRLRAEIETRLPPGVGRLAAYLDARKDVLRARFPDPADRRVFLTGLSTVIFHKLWRWAARRRRTLSLSRPWSLVPHRLGSCSAFLRTRPPNLSP